MVRNLTALRSRARGFTLLEMLVVLNALQDVCRKLLNQVKFYQVEIPF